MFSVIKVKVKMQDYKKNLMKIVFKLVFFISVLIICILIAFATQRLLHNVFNFFGGFWQIITQAHRPIFGNPIIVFYANADAFFWNINSRFNSNYISFMQRSRVITHVMHIKTKIMANTMRKITIIPMFF